MKTRTRRTRRAPRTLRELTTLADDHAKELLSTKNFHLQALNDVEFPEAMKAVLAGLRSAWAAGYAARDEERSR